MKAYLKNYRQSPRKVRLVAGLLKGRGVNESIAELDFLAKRAGLPIRQLLLSAVANATSMGIDKDNLLIKELRVDKGVTLKRMMPAAMGTGHRINKRTSHVTLVLIEKANTKNKTDGNKRSKKVQRQQERQGKLEKDQKAESKSQVKAKAK